MARYKKTCAFCGNPFESNNARATCCDIKCYRLHVQKKKQDDEDKKRIKNITNNTELINMAVEAKKRGMSYGQHVGLLELEKQKKEREKV